MLLSHPHQVYSQIYYAMSGKQVNPSTAALFLEDHFKNKKKADEPMKVVLIDELDALMTKK